jgi:hypothetical protein
MSATACNVRGAEGAVLWTVTMRSDLPRVGDLLSKLVTDDDGERSLRMYRVILVVRALDGRGDVDVYVLPARSLGDELRRVRDGEF